VPYLPTGIVTEKILYAIIRLGLFPVLQIRIRDPGWVKNQDPDLGSGINIPDHISRSLETIFWVKNS
jgi:hypothetical protein